MITFEIRIYGVVTWIGELNTNGTRINAKTANVRSMRFPGVLQLKQDPSTFSTI